MNVLSTQKIFNILKISVDNSTMRVYYSVRNTKGAKNDVSDNGERNKNICRAND